MSRGKKQWIHRSNKKRNGNSDIYKLDELHAHLENLGYHVYREPYIKNGNFSTKNRLRNPDLQVHKDKFECLLELDGKVHGNLELPTDKTIRRNSDYEKSNINYILLNEEDARFFKLDICDLAGYRINEEYSKHIAKLNAGSLFV